MNKAERLWSLRDGVLAWLYELRVGGTTIDVAIPAAFIEATSWPDTDVTRPVHEDRHHRSRRSGTLAALEKLMDKRGNTMAGRTREHSPTKPQSTD